MYFEWHTQYLHKTTALVLELTTPSAPGLFRNYIPEAEDPNVGREREKKREKELGRCQRKEIKWKDWRQRERKIIFVFPFFELSLSFSLFRVPLDNISKRELQTLNSWEVTLSYSFFWLLHFLSLFFICRFALSLTVSLFAFSPTFSNGTDIFLSLLPSFLSLPLPLPQLPSRSTSRCWMSSRKSSSHNLISYAATHSLSQVHDCYPLSLSLSLSDSPFHFVSYQTSFNLIFSSLSLSLSPLPPPLSHTQISTRRLSWVSFTLLRSIWRNTRASPRGWNALRHPWSHGVWERKKMRKRRREEESILLTCHLHRASVNAEFEEYLPNASKQQMALRSSHSSSPSLPLSLTFPLSFTLPLSLSDPFILFSWFLWLSPSPSPTIFLSFFFSLSFSDLFSQSLSSSLSQEQKDIKRHGKDARGGARPPDICHRWERERGWGRGEYCWSEDCLWRKMKREWMLTVS